MTPEEIQAQLEQASRNYNDGLYDDAIALWKSVLQAEPENPRAREGVQMAELLTKDWGESDPAVLGFAQGGEEGQVQEALERVEQLISAGDLDAAREGVEVLLQIAPENAAVLSCAARLESASDPSGYVDEQLSLARHYIMMGEPGSGIEACRRVLAVDPDNDEAKELMSQAGGRDALDPSVPASGVTAAGPDAAGAPPVTPELDTEDFLNFDLDDFNAAPVALAAGATMDAGAGAAAAPVAPAAADADAGTAEERIATLLVQGDELQTQGQLQEAIQIWSRVFILDDNNAEAEARVDAARRLLDEQAGQVDELRYRGEDLLKSGQLLEAKAAFEQVLVILPNHQEAKDLLRQIEQRLAGGDFGAVGDAGEEIESVLLGAPVATAESVAAEVPCEDSVAVAPRPEPVAPRQAAPAAAMAVPSPLPPAASRRGPGPVVLLVGGLVLAVGLGYGGYIGWQMFFPVGPSAELAALEAQPLNINSSSPTPVELDGQNPDVANLTEAAPSPSKPADGPHFIEVGEALQASDLVNQGSRLFEAGQYDKALDVFRSALHHDPGSMEAKDWEIRAADEVERRARFEREIASARAAFTDYDYESALKKLYRLESPTQAGEARIKQWTATCWYNWGVLRLQAGRTSEAREKFQEAIQLLPGDAETESHLEVLRRYEKRSLDSTFKAYSESVILRALE